MIPQVLKPRVSLFVAVLLLIAVYVVGGNEKHSPYYQHLEDCDQKEISSRFCQEEDGVQRNRLPYGER